MFPASKPTVFTILLILVVGVLPRFMQEKIFTTDGNSTPVYLEFRDWRIRHYPPRDEEEILEVPLKEARRMAVISPRRAADITSVTGIGITNRQKSTYFTLLYTPRGENYQFMAISMEDSFSFGSHEVHLGILLSSDLKIVYIGTRQRLALREGRYYNPEIVDDFLASLSGVPMEELPHHFPEKFNSHHDFFQALSQAITSAVFRLGAAYAQHRENIREADYLADRLRKRPDNFSPREKLFIRYCSQCHGIRGTGISAGGAVYEQEGGEPLRSFRDGQYWEQWTDRELEGKILYSPHHSQMHLLSYQRSLEELSKKELQQIIQYIRKLAR